MRRARTRPTAWSEHRRRRRRPHARDRRRPGVAADAAAAVDHAQLDAGQHVVHIASKYIGTPYVWGGESPSGFDCSGLVQYCFKQIGVHLERTTWDQVKEGHAVPWGQFKPGDLIFSNFEGPGAGATHVVIYAGHGQVIAAPHTGGHVEYESVDVFKPYFMGARRVVPDAPGGRRHAGGGAGRRRAPPAPAVRHARHERRRRLAGPPAPALAPNAAGVHSTIGSIPHPRNAVDAAHGAGAGALDAIIGAYPGDHAPRSAIAAWMGDAAQRAGLPRELPVMAALVESGLKNDNYGDRDSLGFFQMRTSIWDHGKYAGFPKDPRLQLRVVHRRGARRSRRAAARGRRRIRPRPAHRTATGSPTSSARRPSTAAATSSSSTPPASSCADPVGGRPLRRFVPGTARPAATDAIGRRSIRRACMGCCPRAMTRSPGCW